MYKTKDIILTGFALFAMLFGAGNLIFPPTVGYIVGDNWKLAALGFCITGIGFPLMGIIASGFAGTELDHFSDKVSPIFSRIFNTVLILAIGPCLAIPRTGATAFEVMITPYIGNESSIVKYIFLIIYFGVVLLFSLRESEVIDRIGKILTPILLIVLTIIIFKGISTPIGEVVSTETTNNFKYGFYNGYQTMDTLAAIIFASIILKTITAKNKELGKKEQLSFLLKASAIAVCGLAIVYGGLLYIGATSTAVLENKGTTQLLNTIVAELLGKNGSMLLGICVAGACLTTAIGLTATVGDYFSSIFKVRYEKIVVINVLVSLIFAGFGVDLIVQVAAPILVFIYPIAIVLIILNLFKEYLQNKGIFIGSVIGAGIIGAIEASEMLGTCPALVYNLYLKLPFQDYGLAWILPSIVVGGIFGMIEKIKK
ncbi:branched-chain amino acid transport system II carrier protein [Fusobacterium necrogenes]|uniref:branched-chain amino acid transport system II carrier protein n=1 Tax=Fusobacterium necrogenes TaxID=858 RepID=UPI00255C6C90|nr:branched-chain amino acid transport system II carrier protein [Fusobacterium necrogenes]